MHQLVRAEYPELVSIARQDFIQLIPYDKEREESQLNRKKQGLDRTLEQQAGLRWIIEALCSNVEKVLPKEHISTISSAAVFSGIMAAPSTVNTENGTDTEHALEVQSLLGKGTVLVGHNLFLDLV